MSASHTGGVKPFSIAGRYVSERERLNGMTDAERAFRNQWLKDQVLSEKEPRFVPELYKELHNPIRRAYRYPLDQLYKVLAPKLGSEKAYNIRYVTGKAFISIFAVYLGYYYFKYNSNNWTSKNGWYVLTSRKAVEKGASEFPKLSERTKPSDYASRGFNNAAI